MKITLQYIGSAAAISLLIWVSWTILDGSASRFFANPSIGGSHTVDDLRITLNEATLTHEWLYAEIEYRNEGPDPAIHIVSGRWYANDTTGKIWYPTLEPNVNELDAGRTATRHIIVPKRADEDFQHLVLNICSSKSNTTYFFDGGAQYCLGQFDTTDKTWSIASVHNPAAASEASSSPAPLWVYWLVSILSAVIAVLAYGAYKHRERFGKRKAPNEG